MEQMYENKKEFVESLGKKYFYSETEALIFMTDGRPIVVPPKGGEFVISNGMLICVNGNSHSAIETEIERGIKAVGMCGACYQVLSGSVIYSAKREV